MLWILQNYFSQNWEFRLDCFFKCYDNYNPEQKEVLDNYAIKYIGADPAGYGYVKMEGSFTSGNGDKRIVIKCETKEILDFVYDRISTALINHPGVIDLRGEHEWGIEII